VTLTKDRPDAFLLLADTFLVSQRSRIAQFAIENKPALKWDPKSELGSAWDKLAFSGNGFVCWRLSKKCALCDN
jgi:hypothetical protein